MDGQPLISVIVPIYNVKPYIKKCLNSLKQQTMKQIEVICIDDGSTDGSGMIAEKYTSSSWPKFRCIHTQNQGLSVARNVGIEEAEAEWLMFLDSDDWVENEFCERPYRTAMDLDADLVVFDRRPVTNERILNQRKRQKQNEKIKITMQKLSGNKWPTGVVSAETAMKYGGNIAWNKLYHRSLFVDVRYPEGRVFEDVATTHKLVFRARCVAMIPDVLVNHLYRDNSISNTYSEKNAKDGFLSVLELYEFMREKNCQVEECRIRLWNNAIKYLMIASSKKDEVEKKAKDVINSIQKPPKEWSVKRRFMLWACKKHKRLFDIICRIFVRRKVVKDTL